MFAIGVDNHVWSTFWGPHEAHPAIRLRTVAGQGRFVEVEGEGFTPNQPVKVGYDIVAGGGPATHQFGEDTVTCDAAGRFIDRIEVNLGGTISGAQAQNCQVASVNLACIASLISMIDLPVLGALSFDSCTCGQSLNFGHSPPAVNPSAAAISA